MVYGTCVAGGGLECDAGWAVGRQLKEKRVGVSAQLFHQPFLQAHQQTSSNPAHLLRWWSGGIRDYDTVYFNFIKFWQRDLFRVRSLLV
jgi:hypothetical protein